MGNARWLGAAGAVLYAIGFVLVSSVPGGGETEAEDFEKFYVTDDRTAIPLIGLFALTIGALALLGFLHELRGTLTDRFGGFGAGVAALGLAIVTVGGSILAGPSGVQAFGDGAFVGESVAHALAQAGFAAMLVPGSLFLGAGVAVLSFVGQRPGVLPKWVAVLGYVAAALQLVAFIWIPAFLIPVWFLVASFTARRAPRPALP